MRPQSFLFIIFGFLGITYFTSVHARTKLGIQPGSLTTTVEYHGEELPLVRDEEIETSFVPESLLNWLTKSATSCHRIISSQIPPLRKLIPSINQVNVSSPIIKDSSSDKIISLGSEYGRKPRPPRPRPPSPRPAPPRDHVNARSPPRPQILRSFACGEGSLCDRLIAFVIDKENRLRLNVMKDANDQSQTTMTSSMIAQA